MKAWKIAASISCCLILATGCSICQNASYECGPVWSQGICQTCNLDYRAGSILNRQGAGVATADHTARGGEPAARSADAAPHAQPPAKVGKRPSEGHDSEDRATAVAQQGQTPKRAPAEGQTTQSPPMSSIVPLAPLPSNLPRGTVAAPPGTKEGDTRVLSVTDRRLDELQRISKPLAAKREASQPADEKPSEDLGGWRPVPNRQAPTETASQLREIDR